MRRVLRNLSWLLGADLFARLAGFLVVSYLARVIGVEPLGVLGFALAALTYGATITDLGLLKLGTRDVAQNRSAAQEYAVAIGSLRLMLAVIGFAGLGVFALLVDKPDTTRLIILSYALTLFPIALQLDWLFQGLEKMEHIAISRSILYLSYLVSVLFAVQRPDDVLRVPLLWLGSNLLASGYLLVVYRIGIGAFRVALDIRFLGILLRSAIPLGVATVLSQVYVNFGFLALGMLAGDAATGLYTAAIRLIFFVMVIDRMFYLVVFPLVARRVSTAPETGQRPALNLMQRLAKLTLVIVLPIAFCTTVLAEPLLTFIYGPDYGAAAPVLAILIWVLVTTVLNSLYSFGLVALSREREYAGSMVHGTLTVILLSLLLCRFFAATGAAVALLAGELVILLLLITRLRRHLPVNPLPFVGRPAVVSAGLAFGLWLLPPGRIAGLLGFRESAAGLVLVGTIILAIAIYAGIMYLVGGYGKDELALLRKAGPPPATTDTHDE